MGTKRAAAKAEAAAEMSPPKKKALKVHAFRHKVDVNSAQDSWKMLEHAIDEIFNQNSSGLSFEELYRNAYNLVLFQHGDTLYSNLQVTLTRHIRAFREAIDAATQRGLFLEEFNNRWLEYAKALQVIRDILMYMDRTYVVSSKKQPVYEVGLNLWKEELIKLSKVQDRLRGDLLGLVHIERTGEIVNRGMMRNVIKLLIDLGPEMYTEIFERHFLFAASEFYGIEAQKFLVSSNCSDYLKMAERRLKEEIDRVSHYLSHETGPKVTGIVLQRLIASNMNLLIGMENSGLVFMLANDKLEDLARMYNLFQREATGVNIICDAMSFHLRDSGKQLVLDPERQKDPVGFVQQLLDFKDKYDRIISSSFNNDMAFIVALRSSIEYLINLSSRAPEFISLFMDNKLRQGLKSTEEDIETVLEKVMLLVRCLQEKDLFEKYYKQHLAKRLLSSKSGSDEAERSLILKLKTECGYQFTLKLQTMFIDMKTSEENMRGFNAQVPSSHNTVSINVEVLTTGSWPIQAGARCILPREILSLCAEFKAFYLRAYKGRRLTWQPNLGTADLKLTVGGTEKLINVSTYQMCILMLFNNADRLSYNEIEQATDIPPCDLKRCLQSLALVKGKNVLRKEPMSKDISETDVFVFNDKFTSKLTKIKISTVAAQKESESEKHETRERIEEDRKPQIEATIVRVMKARQSIQHNDLISEVTKQLQARFLPNPLVIKKRIESLIEREFLERDKADRKLYRYLA